MPSLSEPITLDRLTVPNRIIRSSTAECMCTADGTITDAIINLYSRLAQGGAGMIVTGGASVHPTGHTYPGVIGIDADDHIPLLRKLAGTIRQHGARAIIQIYHCGRQRSPQYEQSLAPSPIPDRLVGTTPTEMSISDIHEIIAAFGTAAKRARLASFDGVQLAACNGHLIGQFLSPYTNRRTDEYGGTQANRHRFFIEVMESVRTQVGGHYPILIKMGMNDFVKNGLTEPMAIAALKQILPYNPCLIEVTGGIYETSFFMARGDIPIDTIMNMPEVKSRWWPARLAVKLMLRSLADRTQFQDAYFRKTARLVKDELSIPVALVGGIRLRSVADDILASNDADLIALSRPLICESNFAEKLLTNPDAKAQCKFCNKCLISIAQGKPLACYGH